MSTGEFKPVTCNANGYCSFRCFSTTGWGCTYSGFCDYQLPKDSREIKKYKLNENGKLEEII